MLKKFVLGGMVVVAALLGNACGDDGSSDSPAGPADSEVTLSSSSDDVIPGNSSSSSVTESPSTSSGQAPQSAESDGSSSSEKAVNGSSSSDGKASSSSGKVESSSNKGEKSSSSKKVESSSSSKADASSSSNKTEASSSSVKTEKSSSSDKPVESSSSETKPVESSSSVENSSSAAESSSATIPSKLYDCEKYKCVTTKYLNPEIDYGEYLDERDSLVYRTVQIGEQVWMAQNMNYYVKGSDCYASDTLKCLSNGRMYPWIIANQICPNGWHLPDTADFNRLVDFVKQNNGGKDVAPNLITGKKDIFGFSSITSGGYGTGAKFTESDKQYYWTSTALEDDPSTIEDESKKAWVRYLYRSGKYLSYERFNQEWLLSIRCLKDSE